MKLIPIVSLALLEYEIASPLDLSVMEKPTMDAGGGGSGGHCRTGTKEHRSVNRDLFCGQRTGPWENQSGATEASRIHCSGVQISHLNVGSGQGKSRPAESTLSCVVRPCWKKGKERRKQRTAG
ncbi:hypothetical protein SLEP1_g2419 [Rubroshorea leprosula]|uniref:Secreted protein n=1 Tax=Rubroshorea leprosula TaxID=152421 RepID=A0AAV5HH46_9ROSI|nr:hypothetical protein SLEP1_g2419 [Rubroshorea leprosula]